jgi:hypothetical protein
MALITSQPADQIPALSLGPVKLQLLNYSVASGDTSAVITAPSLFNVTFYMIHGISETAAGVISGNQVTLTFADPLATRYGQILLFGR